MLQFVILAYFLLLMSPGIEIASVRDLCILLLLMSRGIEIASVRDLCILFTFNVHWYRNYVPPTEGGGDILFLVRIPSASASASA